MGLWGCGDCSRRMGWVWGGKLNVKIERSLEARSKAGGTRGLALLYQ